MSTEVTSPLRLHTVKESAKLLHLSPATVYDLILQGRIVAVRPTGKTLRITTAALERYVDELQRDADAVQGRIEAKVRDFRDHITPIGGRAESATRNRKRARV